MWRCAEGHEWKAVINSRVAGNKCPFCSNQRVLPEFNDLATTNPELASEALFDATKVTAGSRKKGMWRCAQGHEWEAVVADRTAGGGCPYCANKRVLTGFNDLATTNPELAKEALFDATKVTAGSGHKGLWRCTEGHEWAATVVGRSRGFGCPNCAKYGYHSERQAWLYLMYHDHWRMLQIGITNVPEIREQQHRRHGWSLIDIRGPMDGVLTQKLERDILKFLKHKAKVTLSTSKRTQHDGTPTTTGEAWPIDQYRIESLSVLLNAVTEWETQ